MEIDYEILERCYDKLYSYVEMLDDELDMIERDEVKLLIGEIQDFLDE